MRDGCITFEDNFHPGMREGSERIHSGMIEGGMTIEESLYPRMREGGLRFEECMHSGMREGGNTFDNNFHPKREGGEITLERHERVLHSRIRRRSYHKSSHSADTSTVYDWKKDELMKKRIK